LTDLLKVMDTLLGEGGCPWDREQTHESLKSNLMEECREAIEAIDNGCKQSLCEELGDVLLQVIFHAKLAEKSETFNLDDVIKAITTKLIRRHTHIFAGDKALTAEEAMALWNENKQKERPHA